MQLPPPFLVPKGHVADHAISLPPFLHLYLSQTNSMEAQLHFTLSDSVFIGQSRPDLCSLCASMSSSYRDPGCPTALSSQSYNQVSLCNHPGTSASRVLLSPRAFLNGTVLLNYGIMWI